MTASARRRRRRATGPLASVAIVLLGLVALLMWSPDLEALPERPASSASASVPVASPAALPPTETATVPATPAAPPATPPAALAALAGLVVDDQGPSSPYDRDLFGQAWADVDRNGCDTRNDVLARDLLDPVFKPGTRDCKVLSGTLIDPYDGSAVSFVSGADTSRLVQIDHVVALSWAWRHGADRWDDDRRTAFANDPANLVAATDDTNRAKSDAGPAQWLPPAPELRCGYVEQFVAVLDGYDLSIASDDRAAAEAVLAGCG